MKKLLFVLLIILSGQLIVAQTEVKDDTSWKQIYRETPAKINDLVHTKLEVKFDYEKTYMHGKVWVTVKPHFYATDSLELDAKGMDIHEVALVKGSTKKKLTYKYDGWKLFINLDKSYKGGEAYTIFIDYTAKPNEVEVKGSAAISDAKGLYFINPKGEEKDKPTQIWTQGETEATSVWCPTIDNPSQKTTNEIYMTVPDKYVTLSNGKLVSQKKNADGTRTDYWKMDLPHSPYLFFMGVGDYAVIKDTWKGKEVNYYVEKEYASVARKIFGHTPEMMSFFSKITGVDYPWIKYSQITGQDYVSGAMENTTATLHSSIAQQDARELIDGNFWEGVIAHELFHHWFGDYVTAESWSNITLNESFADYSETLWDEYKYGKDAGDATNSQAMQAYLGSPSADKNLVRFNYHDKEDVFDLVSYQKGGRILHMLRNFVGDSAFFRSINNYLTTNKFKSAEAHQLRLAFEEVTGKDLNWFFNQWYFNNGHPNVTIDYIYDDATKQVKVILQQKQKNSKLFQLPLAIDVYEGAKKKSYQVWAKNETDTFTFSYDKRPDLVNVDAGKTTLWTKKDNKTLDNYIHQYKYAGNYIDRREAIDFAATKQNDPKAADLMMQALNDKYSGLRNLAISKLDLKNEKIRNAAEPILLSLAKKDVKATVRAQAIEILGEFENKEYAPFFKTAIYDSSYTVAGNALTAFGKLEPEASLSLARELAKKTAKGFLQSAIMTEIVKSGDESMAEEVIGGFAKMPLGQNKFQALGGLNSYLSAIKNPEKVKWGVDEIVKFRDEIPEAYRGQTDPYINGMILKGLLAKKDKEAKESSDYKLKELAEYIKSKLPEADKKGF